MTAAQRMRTRLNATGCYRMTGETSADWETEACGAGVDAVEEEIASLLEDLFPATAGEGQLRQWEALYRPEPAGDDLQARREMTACRLAMSPGLLRPEEYGPVLRSAGVIGTVLEKDGAVQVLVGRLLDLPEAEIRRELDQLLPAHLPWELVDEMNWTVLDAWTAPFETLDSRGLTWSQLDGLTREQLEEYKEE